MARGLHGTGFVDIDVGRIRPDHALMGPQGGINDRQIGLEYRLQENGTASVLSLQRERILSAALRQWSSVP